MKITRTIIVRALVKHLWFKNKDDRKHSMWVSALAMGVVGAIAGYFTHEGLEYRDAQVRRNTLFNLEKFGVTGFDGGGSSATDESNKPRGLSFTDPDSTEDNNQGEQ